MRILESPTPVSYLFLVFVFENLHVWTLNRVGVLYGACIVTLSRIAMGFQVKALNACAAAYPPTGAGYTDGVSAVRV